MSMLAAQEQNNRFFYKSYRIESEKDANKFYRDGTHRIVPPEQTLARVMPLMRVIGITRVSMITGLDHLGIPVAMACRPNARSLSVAQGKGTSIAAAKVSALMEALEAYHAERIALPLKLGSFNELRFSHRMANIFELPRSSAQCFHENLRTLWIEGMDWVSGQSLWLPYECVHMDFTLPLPSGSGSFFMSSSGLASGNHLLEALSHGICELVEHDAATLWHLQSNEARDKTRLNLSTVGDPGCLGLLHGFERAGIETAVWDMSTDIGIASYLCTIADKNPNPMQVIPTASGMGSHPSRSIALSRALTEAAQSRLTIITGARDDTHKRWYGGPKLLEETKVFLNWARAQKGVRGFEDSPHYEGSDLYDDIEYEIDQIIKAGLSQVIAIDLTKKEFGIPVLRTVIPGLEGLWDAPGYIPGARARRILREVQQ